MKKSSGRIEPSAPMAYGIASRSLGRPKLLVKEQSFQSGLGYRQGRKHLASPTRTMLAFGMQVRRSIHREGRGGERRRACSIHPRKKARRDAMRCDAMRCDAAIVHGSAFFYCFWCGDDDESHSEDNIPQPSLRRLNSQGRNANTQMAKAARGWAA